MTPRFRTLLVLAAAGLFPAVGCDSTPTAPTAPPLPETRKPTTAGPEAKPGEKNAPAKQNTRSFD